MTPSQIDLVRGSFQNIAMAPEAAGELFYRRLFQLDPGAQALFLEQLRGPAFSREERDAWHAAFAFLSDIMQEGAVESPRR